MFFFRNILRYEHKKITLDKKHEIHNGFRYFFYFRKCGNS